MGLYPPPGTVATTRGGVPPPWPLGMPLVPIAGHGNPCRPWPAVVGHGWLWPTMAGHGQPWPAVAGRSQPWLAMADS